ncbi:MAG: FHA domain-containing protein, partial [Xanthomonas perforans]|nr:FHA domain-containing protein [Xanthomonas perforans]
MRDLQVHFTHRQQPDHSLKPGVHRIVRHASGSVRVVADAQGALLLAQFCLDQRGLWLQVANGIRGIHVNGRPVRRMAL